MAADGSPTAAPSLPQPSDGKPLEPAEAMDKHLDLLELRGQRLRDAENSPVKRLAKMTDLLSVTESTRDLLHSLLPQDKACLSAVLCGEGMRLSRLRAVLDMIQQFGERHQHDDWSDDTQWLRISSAARAIDAVVILFTKEKVATPKSGDADRGIVEHQAKAVKATVELMYNIGGRLFQDQPVDYKPVVRCEAEVLPSLSGFQCQPPLPQGLSLSPATGVISGTPKVKSPEVSYTVTAGFESAGEATVVTTSMSFCIVNPWDYCPK